MRARSPLLPLSTVLGAARHPLQLVDFSTATVSFTTLGEVSAEFVE